MSERERRRLRLAFEPNRFAAEQLVKVYEQLKPMESGKKPQRAVAKASGQQQAAAKGGRA
jgi:hypothetical protein